MLLQQSFLSRRIVLQGLAAMAAPLTGITNAQAESADMEAAIRSFVGTATLQTGKVKLDVAPLVENGNSVSIAVEVDYPMTPQTFVKRIAVFNEKNPQHEVAVFHLNPRCGTSKVATRIRLATTQNLAAVAELSDGSFWADRVEVIVTIAACTEE